MGEPYTVTVVPGSVPTSTAPPDALDSPEPTPEPPVWPWWLAGGGFSVFGFCVAAAIRWMRGPPRRGLVGRGEASFGLPRWVDPGPLLTAEERRQLSAGLGSYGSEDVLLRLDPAATVEASTASGGIPRFVYARRREERALWLFEDETSVALLQPSVVTEVLAELRSSGAPHERFWFGLDFGGLRSENGPVDLGARLSEGFEPVVVVVSDGRALLDGASLSARSREVLSALGSAGRVAVVDASRSPELARALEGVAPALVPEALGFWLGSGVSPRAVEAGFSPSAADLEGWLGLVHRVEGSPLASAGQALRLRSSLGLGSVRALHLPELLRLGVSPVQLSVPPASVSRARSWARRAWPERWRAAGAWWLDALDAEASLRAARDPGWGASASAQTARLERAWHVLQVSEDAESAQAAAELLWREGRDHAEALKLRLGRVSEEDVPGLAWGARTGGGGLVSRLRGERPPWPVTTLSVALLGLAAGVFGVQSAVLPPEPPETSEPEPLADAGGAEEHLKLRFVPLSGGDFCMGSPPEEPGRDDDEARRWVRLDGFALAETETTHAAYTAWRAKRDAYAPEGETRPTAPATDIDWDSARAFCRSLGPGFDLPTEAQWEYGARGGSSSAHSFGADEAELGEYAWYEGNPDDEARPVGGKRPNPVGLYDMHGNVWEWVRDGYRHHDEEEVSTYVDKPCFQCGPGAGLRLHRGGSFDSLARDLRSAVRGRHDPGFRSRDRGFRCAGPAVLELGLNTRSP